MRLPRATVVVLAAIALTAGLLAYRVIRGQRRGDLVITMVVKPVPRQPLPISAEEVRIAKSGKQSHGHRLSLQLPEPWFISHSHLTVYVTVENTEGGALRLPGHWIPEGQGACGLPPEMLLLEVSRDGFVHNCDLRPGGPDSYGGLLNSGFTYPMYLDEYGDFSKPGRYAVRLIAKCPLYGSRGQQEIALLASNQIEFEIPQRLPSSARSNDAE